jgi:hypothetical protein
MSVDATSQERRAASATTDPARIHELLLANLFAVFSERDPERRLQVIERNSARGQRDRRGGGARWTDRPPVHALER